MNVSSQSAEETLTLNIGPQNPVALGPLRIKVWTDGETVLKGEPDVGYLHRGIEKIAERVSWIAFSPFTDRVDYLSAMHCNLAYALAVEKLASIEVPARASQIRVIVGELNRIASHLYTLAFFAGKVGADTALMYMLRDRERINNLFEMVCGSRLTYNYIRIGGVSLNVTEGFIEKSYEFLQYFEPKLREYNDIVTGNHIFRGRLEGIGIIAPERAIDLGISGPNLRGSGVDWDLRKNQPYCGYENYEFKTQVGHSHSGILGDCFNRFMVRLGEIEQSMRIVKQALGQLSAGEFKADPSQTSKIAAGEAYAAVESPRGLLGVYVCSNGGKYPERVKFRTPSFNALNLFPEILVQSQISDVSTIVGSLDIMVSEVDR